MAAAIFLLVTGVVIAGILINLYLRSWVASESRAEARMHDPHTPTVAYAVPNGVDPVALKFELERAGFRTGTDRVGEAECLLVQCEPGQRSRVREVIANVRLRDFDGSDLSVDHVVFEDEH